MKTFHKVLMVGALLAVLAAGLLATPGIASAHTTATQRDLVPDLNAYCALNLPHQIEQADQEWHVAFLQAVGHQAQNDWKCRYQIYPTLPIWEGENTAFIPLPSYHEDDPVNWNALCNQQYPGAHAEWVDGTLVAPTSWGQPWECVGAPDVRYALAENADGTHDIIPPPDNGGW